MILTITLNPLLEKTFFYKKINLKEINRATDSLINAGGKGINVSRQLNFFRINNIATGFIGGENGKILKQLIHKENIKNSFINIKNETREGFVVIDKETSEYYTFFGVNPFINENEIDEFIQKTKKMIVNSEMVIFSGTYPNEECFRIIEELIPYSNQNDKTVLFDINTPKIKSVLKLEPLIIHLNKNEIETSFNISLATEQKKIEFLKQINSEGIKIFLMTDGKEDLYAINQSFIYKVKPPEIKCLNSTGSGDAFVAGFCYGFYKSLPFEDTLKIATASGALNAKSFEVCRVNYEEALSLAEKINVEKFN